MKINEKARLRIERPHGIPILIIEDFYTDPQSVRARACAAQYDLSIAQYPGRHAGIDSTDADLRAVFETLARIASTLGDRTYRAGDFFSDFSIVTTRPEDLLPSQQHPHIDPTPVLGLVYLTPGSVEGTCFYYNELLGTAVIRTDEQAESHREFMHNHAARLAPSGYDFEGHSVWKKFHTIEPVFNRFVLYPGNVFHSIDIKHIDETIDLERVRVTQRFIVETTHPRVEDN